MIDPIHCGYPMSTYKRNPPGVIPLEQPIRIGAIVYPRLDQIDLTGPFAVLSRLPNSSFQMLWKTTAAVRDFRGLGLVPDATLAEAKPFDLLPPKAFLFLQRP